MKIRTNEDIQQTRLPKTFSIDVCHPITKRIEYQITLNRSEAESAVKYLRTHNGSAPQFVHAFIDAMEFALTLRI